MALDVIWLLSVSLIFMEVITILLAIANTLNARPKKKRIKDKSTRINGLVS